MKKIMGFALGITMTVLTPAVGNADLLSDSVLIQKYQEELDAGNLEEAYRYINQVKLATAKMSGINIVYTQAIEESKCSFAKIILDEYEDTSGMGIKDYMQMQYGSCG